MTANDFIGAGWSYPLGTDATGGIALVNREREIEQAIRLILGTACGERPMRPEFGCRIHDHVFNTATSATAGQIAYDVRQALDRWEPRIELRDVSVSFDAIASGTLYVEVPAGSGAIRFEDPRLSMLMASPPRLADAPETRRPFVTIDPRPGLLLMWESFLRHEVLAGPAKSDRLSISFNFA